MNCCRTTGNQRTNQDGFAGGLHSKSVLIDIMHRAGVASILITSTARTPADQARIMYDNIERYGVAHQKLLYGKHVSSMQESVEKNAQVSSSWGVPEKIRALAEKVAG